MASKKWTNTEMFFIRCGQFDIKYLHMSKKLVIALLRNTVLHNRSEEAINKKLKNV